MHEARQIDLNDSRHYASDMRQLLTAVIDHARKNLPEISDPKARALFETSAEVLIGLRKAFEDFEQCGERAWRKAS